MSDERVALELAFEAELRQTCEQAKREAGYYAARFLQMLDNYGAVESVKLLLPKGSSGFNQLYWHKRLRPDVRVPDAATRMAAAVHR
ncbi:MAG: hypothetical protein F4174_11290 [Acidobacteria bacterium]|nr:hypothetical protein [Acidobacteriota bacterium]